ncbi:MAG: major capsid protein [Acidobacteria bacterium]|nr:major capsid protein [Acidobacteriota bacterium]
MKAPFPITPVLTQIAIAYRNGRLIADSVLPRVPVAKQEFKYRKFALADGFTLPDTKVGRTSQPNKVEFGFEEVTESTRDYGLDDPIPQADIENAPENYDPLGRSTEQVTDLILLDREVRTANLVFNPANYATDNKETLSGTTQWSDFEESDPIGAILAALDACVMRPNIGIFGQTVWTKLRQHPKIVKAVLGNSGDSGVASRAAVAELLELEALFVGQAWLNSARKGQDATLARTWGKHASFIYRDSLATAESGVTFGLTAQWGDRVAGAVPDKDIGLRGGQVVRVGESVKEVICANDLGYFFQDAVA